jgi:hypothetical protein
MNTEPMGSQLGELATRLQALGREAVHAYTPVVDGLIRSGSRDTTEIERTLDELLGFCGNEAALVLYRRLCQHYSAIDPAATVEYVHAYREMWDSDASTEASS